METTWFCQTIQRRLFLLQRSSCHILEEQCIELLWCEKGLKTAWYRFVRGSYFMMSVDGDVRPIRFIFCNKKVGTWTHLCRITYNLHHILSRVKCVLWSIFKEKKQNMLLMSSCWCVGHWGRCQDLNHPSLLQFIKSSAIRWDSRSIAKSQDRNFKCVIIVCNNFVSSCSFNFYFSIHKIIWPQNVHKPLNILLH